MAKGGRGGQRANTSLLGGGNIQPTATPQTQQAQQPQVDDTQQAQAMSAQYDAFMQMTDDQKTRFYKCSRRNQRSLQHNDKTITLCRA